MDAFYSLIQTIITTFLVALMMSIFTHNALASSAINDQIDDIRTGYSNLQIVNAEFNAARNQGELNARAQSEYLAWIRQLRDQLARDCAALTQTDRAALPQDLPCDEILTSSLMPANINLATEHTKTEQTEGLLDELNASMGEFDERLLQEQARVKAQVPRVESTSGDSGSGQAASQGGEGTYEGTDTTASTSQSPDQGTEGESQTTLEQAQGEGENTVSASGASGTVRPVGNNDIPENIPDGSDDDVVARQLREAAEKETDPELKKKLWEEYRRYKDGTT